MLLMQGARLISAKNEIWMWSHFTEHKFNKLTSVFFVCPFIDDFLHNIVKIVESLFLISDSLSV